MTEAKYHFFAVTSLPMALAVVVGAVRSSASTPSGVRFSSMSGVSDSYPSVMDVNRPAAGAVMLPRPAPAFSSWCSSALSASRSPCEMLPLVEPKSRELRSRQMSSSSDVLPAETAALSCRMALRTSLSRSDAPEALPARASRLET